MLLMKEGDPATHARIHFLMDHTQVFVVFSFFFISNDKLSISRRRKGDGYRSSCKWN